MTTTPIIDWTRTARRMVRSIVVLQLIAVMAWIVTSLAGDGFDLGVLAGFVGLALLATFAAEVFIVGGSALKGMYRAGLAGDRLSSSDVGLLPVVRAGGLRQLADQMSGGDEESDVTGS